MAVAETQFGTDAKIAFGEANVDFESFADQKAVVLSSPSTEAGELALTAVYFLFKGDKKAVGFEVALDCAGNEGYISFVIANSSKKGNIREAIFPISGMEIIDGKKIVRVANPKRYMDKDGNIEVHISVVGGYALTLNSISVEFEENKTEAEFKEPLKPTQHWYGALPPKNILDISEVMLHFHRGEVWLWVEQYGKKKYTIFDVWWSKLKYQPPASPEKYIFHFNREEVNK